MTSSILTRHLAPLVVAAIVTLALSACTEDAAPTPTPTEPRPSATASPSPSVSLTPSATPSATASATRTPTATPTGPVSTATPPPGYAQSCAAGREWDVVSTPKFVCIDSPVGGTHIPRGTPLVVRGYVGGSFENNVVVAVYRVLPDGTLETKPILQQAATARTAGGYGPGLWEITLNPAPATRPLTVRISAYFGSPRGLPEDAVTVEAAVGVVLD